MPDAQLRVLVFEEDEEHARHLKKVLQAPGCEAVVESSLYQATRRFKNAPFDLSIVSLDMPDDEGEELAWWLLENFPRRQVILTGSEVLPEQEDLLASKSVIGFYPTPVPAQVLAGVLRSSDRGLRGQVQRMQVSDLLQALRYSQQAITLMFEDAILQQEGLVYMRGGDIVHVEVYQRNPITRTRTLLAKGHEGFDLMMSFKNGTFSEQVWQEPPERSVTIPFDGLMMNAAQKRDESLWSNDESIRIRKALLIDNEAMSRMMLQQGLLAEGIDCVSLRSLDLVKNSLESQKSELLIIDSELEHDDVFATLAWLKSHASDCRVLLLGSPPWQDDLPMPCQVLPRPISPKRLKEILFELTQVGFRGFLNRIGVLDFLQLNLSAIDESKKLHIRDLSNRVDGQIYIDRGRFIHAEFGELQGEDAFFRIAAIEKGDFFEDPSFQPPARSLAEIMPHKLMINAGRFAKPLEEPESLIVDPGMNASAHLDGVAAKLQESSADSAGSLDLFGDDDLSEISLNLAGADAGGVTSLFGDDDEPIRLNLAGVDAGGVTSLFGDDDEPIRLNLAGAESAAGGVTNLFGDDEADEIKLNLGATLGVDPAPAGGITSLFGDDEAGEIKLNLGAALGESPVDSPAGGVTSLFGDDDEIRLNLGGAAPAAEAAPVNASAGSLRPANGPLSEASRQAAGSPRPATGPLSAAARQAAGSARPATGPLSEARAGAAERANAASNKLEEMRARFAERRAALIGKTGPLPTTNPARQPGAAPPDPEGPPPAW